MPDNTTGLNLVPSPSPKPSLNACSELDEDSEEERKRVAAASKQQAAFVDVQTMDDEVERVLGWRCDWCRKETSPESS